MSTRITNITAGVATLPPPYRGSLVAGSGAIVSDEIATVLSNLGGPEKVLGTFRLDVTTEPGDPQYGSDVEVFADPINGDDANPGTETRKVKTFQRAWTLGAVPGARKRRIYLDAGTYPCTAPSPGQDTVFYAPPPLDEGEYLTVIGTPVDAGLGLLTATLVDLHVNQISIPAHAPNSMIGATLRVVNNNGGGTAAGARCMVKADDGVILTLANSLEWVSYGGIMLAGDQLVLERPGSILTCDTNFGFGGEVCFKDTKVDATAGSPGIMVFEACTVHNALNLELVANEVAIINNSQFSPSAIGVIFYDPPPFDTFLESGGVYIHDAIEVIIEQGGRFQRTNAISSSAVVFRDCAALVVHESGVFSMIDGGAAFLNTPVTLDGSTCLFRMVGAFDGVKIGRAHV